MAADRLAQRMHDQRCAHRLGLEQVRRGHGAVHHVEQAALRAQRCRCRPGPRPGCADWRWSPRTPCRVSGRRAAATLAASVASTSVTSQPSWVRVFIQLAVLPNRKRLATTWSPFFSSARMAGADGRHAGGEAHRAHRVFHQADLGFQRGRGGVALAAVDVAAVLALEHGGEFFGGGVAVGRGDVQRLEHRAMLDACQPVGVQDAGGDVLCHGSIVQLSQSSRQAGSRAWPAAPGLRRRWFPARRLPAAGRRLRNARARCRSPAPARLARSCARARRAAARGRSPCRRRRRPAPASGSARYSAGSCAMLCGVDVGRVAQDQVVRARAPSAGRRSGSGGCDPAGRACRH